MIPVLLALDYRELGPAISVARATRDHVGGFKVGLELLMSEGLRAVSTIAELDRPVLADAKLHDIPNTVHGAAARLGTSGARWVTVHASGGREMMSAAAQGLTRGAGGDGVGVLAVTVLTSLDETDLNSLGTCRSIAERVVTLARLASESGVEGVVCSPHELTLVNEAAPELLKVTPGIRISGSDSHDQRRFADPASALAAGADWLVIGRAITQSADPAEAARGIAEVIAPIS